MQMPTFMPRSARKYELIQTADMLDEETKTFLKVAQSELEKRFFSKDAISECYFIAVALDVFSDWRAVFSDLIDLDTNMQINLSYQKALRETCQKLYPEPEAASASAAGAKSTSSAELIVTGDGATEMANGDEDCQGKEGDGNANNDDGDISIQEDMLAAALTGTPSLPKESADDDDASVTPKWEEEYNRERRHLTRLRHRLAARSNKAYNGKSLMRIYNKEKEHMPASTLLFRSVAPAKGAEANCESNFSALPRLITPGRNRLDPETVAKLLFLKSNWDLVSGIPAMQVLKKYQAMQKAKKTRKAASAKGSNATKQPRLCV